MRFFLRIALSIILAGFLTGTCDAHTQRRQQVGLVVVREGQKECRGRCCDHDDAEHRAPAILVRPYAQHEPDERTRQDRRADQQAEFRFAETQLLFDLDSDDRKDRPDREADRE